MYRIGQVGPRERISECFSVLEGLENSAASNSALSEAGDLYQTAEQ
jgi:hypothetical protein